MKLSDWVTALMGGGQEDKSEMELRNKQKNQKLLSHLQESQTFCIPMLIGSFDTHCKELQYLGRRILYG